MLNNLLPEVLLNAMRRFDQNKITELRLRRNCPVVMNYFGKNIMLTSSDGQSVYCNKDMIDFVVRRGTENSLYAYNHQIKQGFITACGGIRIGIAGESVNSDNFLPKTIKDICSINIRIPHEVINCSAVAFKFIYSQGQIKNTLIVSPPGAGKTTYLRDIARKISEIRDKVINVLVVDERYEIASCLNGSAMLNVGKFADIVSGASKKYAFTNGVRALRPDVIITDELADEEDIEACMYAINSGVKVVASVHGDSLAQLKSKQSFNKVLNENYFERIVVLSDKNGPGFCKAIFNENLNCIYF